MTLEGELNNIGNGQVVAELDSLGKAIGVATSSLEQLASQNSFVNQTQVTEGTAPAAEQTEAVAGPVLAQENVAAAPATETQVATEVAAEVPAASEGQAVETETPITETQIDDPQISALNALQESTQESAEELEDLSAPQGDVLTQAPLEASTDGLDAFSFGEKKDEEAKLEEKTTEEPKAEEEKQEVQMEMPEMQEVQAQAPTGINPSLFADAPAETAGETPAATETAETSESKGPETVTETENMVDSPFTVPAETAEQALSTEGEVTLENPIAEDTEVKEETAVEDTGLVGETQAEEETKVDETPAMETPAVETGMEELPAMDAVVEETPAVEGLTNGSEATMVPGLDLLTGETQTEEVAKEEEEIELPTNDTVAETAPGPASLFEKVEEEVKEEESPMNTQFKQLYSEIDSLKEDLKEIKDLIKNINVNNVVKNDVSTLDELSLGGGVDNNNIPSDIPSNDEKAVTELNEVLVDQPAAELPNDVFVHEMTHELSSENAPEKTEPQLDFGLPTLEDSLVSAPVAQQTATPNPENGLEMVDNDQQIVGGHGYFV